jgi:ribonuclease P/MRP protein subunit POP5
VRHLKRVKRRYLALRLECEALPTEREIIDTLWVSITKLFGEVGASLSGLTLISFDVERKVAVIRVFLSALTAVRASIATVTNLAGKEASVHVLAISGTLKALYSRIN